MSEKMKHDFDAFVEESKKIRKKSLSKEDIDRFNEIAKRAEIEENESENDHDQDSIQP